MKIWGTSEVTAVHMYSKLADSWKCCNMSIDLENRPRYREKRAFRSFVLLEPWGSWTAAPVGSRGVLRENRSNSEALERRVRRQKQLCPGNADWWTCPPHGDRRYEERPDWLFVEFLTESSHRNENALPEIRETCISPQAYPIEPTQALLQPAWVQPRTSLTMFLPTVARLRALNSLT